MTFAFVAYDSRKREKFENTGTKCYQSRVFVKKSKKLREIFSSNKRILVNE